MADEVTDPLNLDVVVRAQAYASWRRFRNFTAREDLIQEGYVWALEHPKRVQEYLDHENPKMAYYWLSRDLWEAMEKYARKDRAAALGYDPADEAFYGKALIDELLPAVLLGALEPPQGATSEVKNTSDPAEGGTWLAMYLDVKSAWEKATLTQHERDIMTMYFGGDDSQQFIADTLEVTQQTVSKTIKRATKKLSDKLGGQRPNDCPNTCECHEGKLRERPGKSGRRRIAA